jgi:hypothetical protein
MQLWRGDERLTLARSPMRNYVHATKSNITYKQQDILPTYHDFEHVHLVMYESWTATFHRLSAVNASVNLAYLASAYNAQWANQAAGCRFYVENAREELDAEGEFYVDVLERKVLLQLPPADDPNGGPPIVLAQLRELVRTEGTAAVPVVGISFEGVTFEHTSVESERIEQGTDGQSGNFLTAAAAHVRFATNVSFINCTFHATGGYAVWAEQGAYNTLVATSALYDLGAGGVRLGRAGASVSESEGHVVRDSILRDGGHVWQMGVGIMVQDAARVTLTHNEIHRFRYSGISTGWTWGYGPTVVHDVVTSFNHIHEIGMGYLSDLACVYTLGHQPGSRIVNNLCSDVQSYNYGGWAYYTDEGSRGEVFASNVAVATKCAGHHQHYGTDNNLTNNVYYDVNIGDVPTPGRPAVLMKGSCDTAIRMSTHHYDARSCRPHTAPWYANASSNCCCWPGCDQGKCSSLRLDTNIIFLSSTSNSTFIGDAGGSPWYGALDNATFQRNVYYRTGQAASAPGMFNQSSMSFTQWQRAGNDAGSVVSDPLFTSNTTFALAADSPALARGFVPIDVTAIGPRPAVVGAAGRILIRSARAASRGQAEHGSGGVQPHVALGAAPRSSEALAALAARGLIHL